MDDDDCCWQQRWKKPENNEEEFLFLKDITSPMTKCTCIGFHRQINWYITHTQRFDISDSIVYELQITSNEISFPKIQSGYNRI